MNSKKTNTETIKQIDTATNSGTEKWCEPKQLASDISHKPQFSPQNFNAMSATTAVPTKKKVDIYERANQRIIEMLEKGDVAWRRTWGSYGLARNYKSGHIYTGINILFMNFLSPHPIPYYLTFNQIKEMGGKVKKGAKAEWVYFYKSYYKDDNGKNISEEKKQTAAYKDKEMKSIRFLKTYPVFNIEDTEGIEWERPAEVNRPNTLIEECEGIIQTMKEQPTFELTDSSKAFYDPKADVINVPDIKQFEKSGFYYRTTFHEIAHWTGAKSRLARPGVIEPIESGSDRYAEEELIAELTSNYLLNVANVQEDEVMEVSAGYLKSWIKRLKKDPKIIFRVAPKAQQATEYILGMKVNNLPL